VLLARSPGSHEIFLVHRADNLRFLGGFVAFPGGKVAPEDRTLAGSADPVAVQRVTAIRELFEETGVLMARRRDGSFPLPDPVLSQWRRDLLGAGPAEARTFHRMLDELELSLHPEDLRYAGSRVTPPFSLMRFDTAFFIADLPPGQQAEVWPGELQAGAWLSATEAVAQWNGGKLLLAPPTLSMLAELQGRPIEELPRVEEVLGSNSSIPAIWFSPAVQMIPLFSRGLPPSTHTNAYLVGTGPRYLIDPGPVDPPEQALLFDILDRHRDEGRPLTAIVLTHHHPDHVGAANACAARYRVPVLAHPETARLLMGKPPRPLCAAEGKAGDHIEVTGFLNDGDTLDLGESPNESGGPVPRSGKRELGPPRTADGPVPRSGKRELGPPRTADGRWALHAIHTPGHAPGHLVFHEPRYRLLFVGDLISMLSSVVIAPPEGNLAQYLTSLRRVLDYPCRILFPAHGGPSTRAAHVLQESIDHRLERERQLLDALADGPRSVPELVTLVYRGLPANLRRFAELQVQAHLEKLAAEGKLGPQR
jgi:glyoxylase-like metal-dependent hydrolase (beta-lactamase superfamily II)/8-oxo-dGTP pyrophosphatase MutT (NUDIX family)